MKKIQSDPPLLLSILYSLGHSVLSPTTSSPETKNKDNDQQYQDQHCQADHNRDFPTWNIRVIITQTEVRILSSTRH